MPLLYLIRHAEAHDLTPDRARPLTDRGREQVRQLARFLARDKAFREARLWHSPLVRAQETASSIAAELRLAGALREVAGLLPDDDPRGMAERLLALEETVAVVGHEPHLSALASLLVTGAAAPAAFIMKKGAALALERAGPRCLVRWHVAPAFLA